MGLDHGGVYGNDSGAAHAPPAGADSGVLRSQENLGAWQTQVPHLGGLQGSKARAAHAPAAGADSGSLLALARGTGGATGGGVGPPRTPEPVHVQHARGVRALYVLWEGVVGLQQPGVVLRDQLPVSLVRPEPVLPAGVRAPAPRSANSSALRRPDAHCCMRSGCLPPADTCLLLHGR